MLPNLTGSPLAGWIDADALGRLGGRIEVALRRSRRLGSPSLVSVTGACSPDIDPAAVIAASRRAGEPWFCLEQPDHDRRALAAGGCVRDIGAGLDGFRAVGRAWVSLCSGALTDGAEGPAGSGLIALGGFAFATDGGQTTQWNGFGAGSLVVPELSLARHAGQVWLSLNFEVHPDDVLDDLVARAERRLGELRSGEPLPLFDPAPASVPVVQSAMPPAHYEAAVARAVQLIGEGRLEKIVLAREVEVHAAAAFDPAALFGVLRESFPSCYVFAVGRGKTTFVGASPELLVRREGQRASTVALAGSSRRSADPAVDQHLGEQLLRSEKDREENAIVARAIGRALRPLAVWVTAAPEPSLARVANIQHLATPVRAQLASAVGALELLDSLHPTPAVGGEPSSVALELIPSLEGLDRGWYAGPIGWTDSTGDGEFCVALRCALLHGAQARCYAGCGIVARLRSCGGARRVGGQARGAAAAAGGLSRRCNSRFSARSVRISMIFAAAVSVSAWRN